MSTVEHELQLKMQAEAEKEEKAAVALYEKMGKMTVQFVKHCKNIYDKSLFQYLRGADGRFFETFDDWRASRGIGRTSFYRKKRLYEALAPSISDEEIAKITDENQELLAKVPKAQRTPEIVEAAKTKKEHEFAPIVEKVVTTHGQNPNTPEIKVVFKANCYVSTRDMIEQAIKDELIKQKIPLDDKGRGLELICAKALAAELNNPQQVLSNMVIDLRNINDGLTRMLEFMHKSELSSDETLAQVKERADKIQDLLLKAMQFALNPAKAMGVKANG